MSENNEIKRKNPYEMDVNVTVDNTAYEDKVIENQNLKSENEQLKADLTLIAEKELKKQSELLGCANTVEAVKEAQEKRAIGSTAYLNNYQVTGGNTQDGGWDDVETMILDLNKSAKSGNKEADKILSKLTRKALSKPLNIELDSPLKTYCSKTPSKQR